MAPLNPILAALTLGVVSLPTDTLAREASGLRVGSLVRITARADEARIPDVGVLSGDRITLDGGVTLLRERKITPRATLLDLALPSGSVRTVPLAGARIEGTLVGVDEDTVTLRSGNENLFVPRAIVSKFETCLEPRSRWERVGKGAAAGALLGAIVGYATGHDSPGESVRGRMALGGAVLLTPIGAFAGLLAGDGNRWTPVEKGEVRFGLRPVPKGAVASFTIGLKGREKAR